MSSLTDQISLMVKNHILENKRSYRTEFEVQNVELVGDRVRVLIIDDPYSENIWIDLLELLAWVYSKVKKTEDKERDEESDQMYPF